MNKRWAGSMVAGLAIALLAAVPAWAALSTGATAPDFTATASRAGQDFTFSLKQALAKGPVVVYFYPAAYTGGCDLEAHTFATEMDKFRKAGTTVIGVSADSIARLNQFSSDPNYCAGKFAVASDPDGRIATQYGLKMVPPQKGVTDVTGKAVTHGFFPRTTFVLARDGKVVKVLSSTADHLTPDQHVKHSLAIVEQLQAGKAP
ncbi:MAG TPA: peroxiredoxin [Rhodanobacteraceae bacterium]|jgi:peroxiredoxin|nr:peroxiredoxin [Rhodanobacteraceae bacterium]